jgi:Mannose-1-phosphate guanylyltransferase
MQIKFVILCGGTGTRLWPLSRKIYQNNLFHYTEVSLYSN